MGKCKQDFTRTLTHDRMNGYRNTSKINLLPPRQCYLPLMKVKCRVAYTNTTGNSQHPEKKIRADTEEWRGFCPSLMETRQLD